VPATIESMYREIIIEDWPNGAPGALSVTFDVDGETIELGHLMTDEGKRLSSLSEGRFGVARGLKRVLATLERSDVRATFFIPGHTAVRFAQELQAIVRNGHEVGHHGMRHLVPATSDAQLQRREFADGLDALVEHLGVKPVGYRSPGWQITPLTRRLIIEHGFMYDSSLMEDDRPYLDSDADGELLELPPHWSLDDVPYFKFTAEAGGNVAAPSQILETWRAELQSVVEEGRHAVITMHPEVIGRGSRIGVLDELLRDAHDRGLWVAPMNEVAEYLRTVAAAQRS
jgi:peptidoglycan-N-acetylglucosamine deacetylase